MTASVGIKLGKKRYLKTIQTLETQEENYIASIYWCHDWVTDPLSVLVSDPPSDWVSYPRIE